MVDKLRGLYHRVLDALIYRFPALEDSRNQKLCGLGVLALLLFIIAIALMTGQARRNTGAPQALASGLPISGDELFLPAEPDLVPDILLERLPRPMWTIEDIRPFWTPPGDEEFWAGELRRAVDQLLEGVR